MQKVDANIRKKSLRKQFKNSYNATLNPLSFHKSGCMKKESEGHHLPSYSKTDLSEIEVKKHSFKSQKYTKRVSVSAAEQGEAMTTSPPVTPESKKYSFSALESRIVNLDLLKDVQQPFVRLEKFCSKTLPPVAYIDESLSEHSDTAELNDCFSGDAPQSRTQSQDKCDRRDGKEMQSDAQSSQELKNQKVQLKPALKRYFKALVDANNSETATNLELSLSVEKHLCDKERDPIKMATSDSKQGTSAKVPGFQESPKLHHSQTFEKSFDDEQEISSSFSSDILGEESFNLGKYYMSKETLKEMESKLEISLETESKDTSNTFIEAVPSRESPTVLSKNTKKRAKITNKSRHSVVPFKESSVALELTNKESAVASIQNQQLYDNSLSQTKNVPMNIKKGIKKTKFSNLKATKTSDEDPKMPQKYHCSSKSASILKKKGVSKAKSMDAAIKQRKNKPRKSLSGEKNVKFNIEHNDIPKSKPGKKQLLQQLQVPDPEIRDTQANHQSDTPFKTKQGKGRKKSGIKDKMVSFELPLPELASKTKKKTKKSGIKDKMVSFELPLPELASKTKKKTKQSGIKDKMVSFELPLPELASNKKKRTKKSGIKDKVVSFELPLPELASKKKKRAKFKKPNSTINSIDETITSVLRAFEFQSSLEEHPESSSTNLRDMPLISFASAPEVKKMKPPQSEVVKEVPGKSKKRGRKKGLKSSIKKKRGRKRIKETEAGNLLEVKTVDDVDRAPDVTTSVKAKKPRKKSQRRTGRRFSVTGYWYIAAGYLNDIISLLEEFDKIKSWRFRDFAQCWREKLFSCIYRGRQTFKELLEFSEEIVLLTKRFLGAPHSVKRRIGALYTLYGLYYKFPLERLHFFYLRFELQEYEDLLALVRPFRTNIENPDPAYIFRKLELDGAIMHCAVSCEPCYDFHNEERENVEIEYSKQRLAKSSAVNIAAPKAQLMADAELLRHYHSIKANLTGQEDKPEKALLMISQDFFDTVSNHLKQLRKDTLTELGMVDDLAEADQVLGEDEGLSRSAAASSPAPGEIDVNGEEDMLSSTQAVVDAVNNSATGLLSQVVSEKNQLTRDENVKEFMRPPTVQDLSKPLRLQNKYGNFKRAQNRSIKSEKITDAMETYNGKLLLDIKSEPTEYQELKEVLLPHPNPPKRKRGRKRPAALLRAVAYSPRKNSQKETKIPLLHLKGLDSSSSHDPWDSKVETDPLQLSATYLPPSELNEGKLGAKLPGKPDASTVIKVRMRSDCIRKSVKLKVKVNLLQFKEMQQDPKRYNNFTKKLKPLIKSTQKGDNRTKEWTIEDIELQEELKDSEDEHNTEQATVKKEPSPPAHPSPQKILPLKARFECLKYSDDDEEYSSDDYEDKDELPKLKKYEIDDDFEPPKEEEIEEDAFEYEDAGEYEDLEDLKDWESPYQTWKKRWRKKGLCQWSSPWDYEFEPRGPRDSDQLLQARTNKSVTMVPMHVGNTVKYFPMVSSNPDSENSKDPEGKISERSEESHGPDEEQQQQQQQQQQLPVDPNTSSTIFTWNDFSSDKFPPFVKKKRSHSFSYILPPRSPTKKRKTENGPDSYPEMKPTKLTVIRPFIPPGNLMLKTKPDLDRKEGHSVIEELEEDWEEDLNSESSMKYDTENTGDKQEQVNGLVNLKVSKVEDNFYDVDTIAEHNYPDEMAFEEGPTEQVSPLSTHEIDYDSREEFAECPSQSTNIVPKVEVDIEEHLTLEQDVYIDDAQAIPNDMMKNLPFETPHESIIAPGTFFVNEPPLCASAAVNTLNSNFASFDPNTLIPIASVPPVMVNMDPDIIENSKQLIYYKVIAPDGNDIFIPVSTFSSAAPRNIEFLSFDTSDVKPLPQTSSFHPVENLSNEEQYMSPVSEPAFQRTPLQPLSLEVPEGTTAFTSTSMSSLPSPKPIPKDISPPTALAKPCCSFIKPTKPSQNLKPSCSFLFSPKFKTLRNLSSSIGQATGRIPSEKPKVKFFFKGFLKS